MEKEINIKRKRIRHIGYILLIASMIAAWVVFQNVNTCVITLSDIKDNVEICPELDLINVYADGDTSVLFVDVMTGQTYSIGYLTPGMSESIRLKKGKWYAIRASASLTLNPVKVRIVE